MHIHMTTIHSKLYYFQVSQAVERVNVRVYCITSELHTATEVVFGACIDGVGVVYFLSVYATDLKHSRVRRVIR